MGIVGARVDVGRGRSITFGRLPLTIISRRTGLPWVGHSWPNS